MSLSPPPVPSVSWQRALSRAIRDPAELLRILSLDPGLLAEANAAAKLFPLFATESYVARMVPGDSQDPLLRQVLPLGLELREVPGFVADAVGDGSSRAVPGLLQKYQGRVLLISTGACAIHCRYCFRRHYPYGEEPRQLQDWEPAFQSIERDDSIHEVILSGGDPLMLTDHRISELVARIEAITHVRRIRIHSRLPIVLPSRVTSELVQILTSGRLTPIVVVHANHPQELNDECRVALKTLVRSGVTMLNQAVLLSGINDDADVLARLCEQLVDLGVMSYYLHQLDRVAGAAHFEVPVETGRRLVAELRRRLPGYAVPQYVREVEGEPHKWPING